MARPATIVIDKHSGQIVQIRPGQLTHEELGLDRDRVEWIEAGNNIVLPGLVEYVPESFDGLMSISSEIFFGS